MSDDQSSKGLDQSSFSLKKDLPQSKYNLSYDSLIQMNKNYLQALSKILNENSISNNKENNLSK